MPRGRRANPENSGTTSAVQAVRSTGRSFEPGAVAIDPLARRRDRLTAIGRRHSDFAKKKSAKKKSYWARGVCPARINFRNRRASEPAGGHDGTNLRCPLYPRKRTWFSTIRMFMRIVRRLPFVQMVVRIRHALSSAKCRDGPESHHLCRYWEKRKGRDSDGRPLKLISRKERSLEETLEEHVGRFRLFDLDQRLGKMREGARGGALFFGLSGPGVRGMGRPLGLPQRYGGTDETQISTW